MELHQRCPSVRTVSIASVQKLFAEVPRLLPYDRPVAELGPDVQRLLVLIAACEDRCNEARVELRRLEKERLPTKAANFDLHDLLCARGKLSGFALEALGKKKERELTVHEEAGLLAVRTTPEGRWFVFPTLPLPSIDPTIRSGYLWTPASALARHKVEGVVGTRSGRHS